MLKERLMNPGSYFRFGWQRETERVVRVAYAFVMRAEVCVGYVYHKGHVR